MRSLEFQPARDLYREFTLSPYYREDMEYLQLLAAMSQFLQSKNLKPEVVKQLKRKVNFLLKPEMESVDL